MALLDSPMERIMYKDALMDLSNGFVSPLDKEVLSYAPLPDNFTDPYFSGETDVLAVMKLSHNSLMTWIEEAKKASYFSKHFVTLSKMIMSGVATMARGLMTLHGRGDDLSLAPMSIQDLIGVGSYHIRKSYLGVLQTSRKNPEIGEHLLMNQLSWTNVIMRLFKTREKLEKPVVKNSACELNNEKPVVDGNSSRPELPSANKVKAFEPFENDGTGLAPASALSELGAYAEPRAYTSFEKSKNHTGKTVQSLPEAKSEKTAALNESKTEAGNTRRDKETELPAAEGKTIADENRKPEETALATRGTALSFNENTLTEENAQNTQETEANQEKLRRTELPHPERRDFQNADRNLIRAEIPDPDHPPDHFNFLYRISRQCNLFC